MSRKRRAYRVLLRFFPSRIRERYGAEMEETFLRLLASREARPFGRVRSWIEATVDAVVRGTALRLRELRPSGPPGSWLDLRFAARSLARRPVFAATAIATLALGIGANTAIFSVVHGLVIRPLPYPAADRIVSLYAVHEELGWYETDVNLADAHDWHTRTNVFESFGAFDHDQVTLTGGDRPELLRAALVTPGLLPLLGAEAALGRGFVDGDMGPSASPTAILAASFWERRFGGDPAVVGSTLMLDDEPTTVIGVLPADFVFPFQAPDVYRPFETEPSAVPRGSHDRSALATLRPGTDLAVAARVVNRVAAELQTEYPEANRGWTAQLVPLRSDLLGEEARPASILLMVAVGFVLLMACANVASLLLARANARREEISVRRALGAARGRIAGLLLVESLLLALVGGTLGVALAAWGSRTLAGRLPAQLPDVYHFALDPAVLAFALAATLGSVLLFGLVPAIRASRPEALDLREGRGGTRGRDGARFGGGIVVVQTALAVVLLVGGGLMVKSVVTVTGGEMGFDPDDVVTVRLTPPETRYPADDAVRHFWDEVMASVRGVAGVREAGSIQSLPLAGSNWGGTVWTPEMIPDEDTGVRVRYGFVSPGYFDAMDVDLLRGRRLEPADEGGEATHALVNETFVRRVLGAEAEGPGATFRANVAEGPITVVGVVEDHLERSLDDPVEPAVYLPADRYGIRSRTIAVRASGVGGGALVDALQEAVWRVDADQPVYEIRTMEEWIQHRAGGFRMMAELMGVFGVLSLLLGAVGIYGVTAHGVSRRTGEIGIRIALGARRNEVVGMVLRQGARRVAAGLIVGLGLAWIMAGGMTVLLIGVEPHDPVVFGSVVVLLVFVGALGSLIPAWRAARVDPVRALAAD